jgi:hypothetical protein
MLRDISSVCRAVRRRIGSTFRERAGSRADVAARVGWAAPIVGTIEGYRGIDERYSFSTEREIVGSVAAGFELLETWRPSYELGERCPQVTFRRRG